MVMILLGHLLKMVNKFYLQHHLKQVHLLEKLETVRFLVVQMKLHVTMTQAQQKMMILVFMLRKIMIVKVIVQ